MTLYEDRILVDCTLGSVKQEDGTLGVSIEAQAWKINHSWGYWALTINDNLIVN